MSLTSTISSWPRSNVVLSTSAGIIRSPAVSSAYARATRSGVCLRPSRSGSSPIAISSSRTAATARSWSNTAPVTSRALTGPMFTDGSLGRLRGVGSRGRRATVDVTAGRRRRQHHAGVLLLGPRGVRPGPVGRGREDLLGHLHRRDRRRLAVGRPGPCGTAVAAAQRREDLGHLRLVEGLLLQELEHQRVEHVAVLLEDVERLLVRLREELLRLLVDDRGDVLGVVAGVAQVAAHERLRVVGTQLDRTQPVG